MSQKRDGHAGRKLGMFGGGDAAMPQDSLRQTSQRYGGVEGHTPLIPVGKSGAAHAVCLRHSLRPTFPTYCRAANPPLHRVPFGTDALSNTRLGDVPDSKSRLKPVLRTQKFGAPLLSGIWGWFSRQPIERIAGRPSRYSV